MLGSGISALSGWPPAAIATVLAAIASAVAALWVALQTTTREARKRRAETSFEITKLLLDTELRVAAARRFAVGVVKITESPTPDHRGLVLFIPLNSRVTIGRDDTNDVVLSATDISRFHCGFVSEGAKVYLEDYCSTNGVYVSGSVVTKGGSYRLRGGDEIEIGDYRLRYERVHCSRIVS